MKCGRIVSAFLLKYTMSLPLLNKEMIKLQTFSLFFYISTVHKFVLCNESYGLPFNNKILQATTNTHNMP